MSFPPISQPSEDDYVLKITCTVVYSFAGISATPVISYETT